MKISLTAIRNFNKFNKTADDVAAIGVDELIEKIGSQLGAVDEVIKLGERYERVVIVKVVSCEKHPDADKLSLCLIDDGGAVKDAARNKEGLVQVVCGAPNVKAGMLAAWLPPGVTVPETTGRDPFVLEAREIRGQVSNGMLASPKELAIGDSHAGILGIDGDFPPGSDFTETFGLKDDVVIDIENKMFTHRPDCFGYLGISRELAGIQHMQFRSPEWYVPSPEFPEVESEELKLEVRNELPEQVPRFTAIAMNNVQVGPSPVWLQVLLAKLGQKSINNIVDYTNYFMLLTGQPLHAYDYDKVKALSGGDGAVIVVRGPKSGEKIKLLGGKEIEPHAEAVMIATDKQAIGLGGVMGGAETEVDETTTNIIIEAANFDMYATRRTMMVHGLFTDAATRFTKGQSPLQPLAVQAKIVNEIRKYAGGKVAGPIIDDNHLDKGVVERGSLHVPVKVSTEFINARLGLELSAQDMQQLLQNVEFKVDLNGDELTVTAPFWRTDIELREDVVEEVGRLYGYDHLPLVLPRQDIAPVRRDPLLDTKAAIRRQLSKAGANEILTYSFVPGDLLDKAGQDKDEAYQISNALSPDLQYYRLSLMPSLLEKIHPNIKAGYDEFALFELGKAHSTDHTDEAGLPGEYEFTALVVAAADKLKKPGAAYYQAREYLEALVGSDALEFKPVGRDAQAYPVVQPYNLDRAALVSIKGGAFLGILGEFKPGAARALKLPKFTAGFEIDTTVLQPLLAAGPSYFPLSRFPGVKQDITLKVPAGLAFAELEEFIGSEMAANAPDQTHIHLAPIDIYQQEADSRHVTFRLTITGFERTLTDKEVNKLLDAVAKSAAAKYKAVRL